jgi:hypothetical protein
LRQMRIRPSPKNASDFSPPWNRFVSDARPPAISASATGVSEEIGDRVNQMSARSGAVHSQGEQEVRPPRRPLSSLGEAKEKPQTQEKLSAASVGPSPITLGVQGGTAKRPGTVPLGLFLYGSLERRGCDAHHRKADLRGRANTVLTKIEADLPQGLRRSRPNYDSRAPKNICCSCSEVHLTLIRVPAHWAVYDSRR